MLDLNLCKLSLQLEIIVFNFKDLYFSLTENCQNWDRSRVCKFIAACYFNSNTLFKFRISILHLSKMPLFYFFNSARICMRK